MAANIFGSRFLGRREPAWHGLGEVFPADLALTASEAVVRAGLDYTIEKTPVFVDLPPLGRVDIGKFALVRQPTPDDPNPAVFGLVGERYGVLQNADIAKALDPLAQQWPVETVGALGSGETVFLTLDAGQGTICGDEMRNFFLVSDTKGQGRSLRIAFTPVRVVCQNTLITGFSQATVSAALFHGRNVGRELEFRIDMFARLQQAKERTEAALASLCAKRVVEDQVNAILTAAYPEPVKPAKVRLGEEVRERGGLYTGGVNPQMVAHLGDVESKWAYAVERVAAYRDAARELYYTFNDEHPHAAQTGWAIYNAVVETEDYRKGADSAAESALFGLRAQAKARAFDACLSLN